MYLLRNLYRGQSLFYQYDPKYCLSHIKITLLLFGDNEAYSEIIQAVSDTSQTTSFVHHKYATAI